MHREKTLGLNVLFSARIIGRQEVIVSNELWPFYYELYLILNGLSKMCVSRKIFQNIFNRKRRFMFNVCEWQCNRAKNVFS